MTPSERDREREVIIPRSLVAALDEMIESARRETFEATREAAARIVHSLLGNPEPVWPEVHDGLSWKAALLRAERDLLAMKLEDVVASREEGK